MDDDIFANFFITLCLCINITWKEHIKVSSTVLIINVYKDNNDDNFLTIMDPALSNSPQ
jgi:hypothetical protein